MKDYLGVDIKIGDFILYLVTNAGRLNMAFYNVRSIADDGMSFRANKIRYRYSTQSWEVAREVTLTKASQTIVLMPTQVPKHIQDVWDYEKEQS